MRSFRALPLTPWLCFACSPSSPPPPSAYAQGAFAPSSIRYRLELRDNAVDPAQAFRCFGGCQQTPTQETYVECLSGCPGFEETRGARCTAADVTPSTACITVNTALPRREPDPGAVVVAIIGSMVLSAATANLCIQPNTSCYWNWLQGPTAAPGPWPQ